MTHPLLHPPSTWGDLSWFEETVTCSHSTLYQKTPSSREEKSRQYKLARIQILHELYVRVGSISLHSHSPPHADPGSATMGHLQASSSVGGTLKQLSGQRLGAISSKALASISGCVIYSFNSGFIHSSVACCFSPFVLLSGRKAASLFKPPT